MDDEKYWEAVRRAADALPPLTPAQARFLASQIRPRLAGLDSDALGLEAESPA